MFNEKIAIMDSVNMQVVTEEVTTEGNVSILGVKKNIRMK